MARLQARRGDAADARLQRRSQFHAFVNTEKAMAYETILSITAQIIIKLINGNRCIIYAPRIP